VPHASPRLPSLLATGIGLGRLAIAAAFLAEPESGLRLLGMDTATAKRAGHVARMLAVRDGILGAGMLGATTRRRGVRGWLLAGALADGVDAAAVVTALRAGQLAGARARAVAAGAGLVAVAGAGAAVAAGR
jgi:hypothetical protein